MKYKIYKYRFELIFFFSLYFSRSIIIVSSPAVFAFAWIFLAAKMAIYSILSHFILKLAYNIYKKNRYMQTNQPPTPEGFWRIGFYGYGLLMVVETLFRFIAAQNAT